MAKKGLKVTENVSAFILLLRYMILYVADSMIKIICQVKEENYFLIVCLA